MYMYVYVWMYMCVGVGVYACVCMYLCVCIGGCVCVCLCEGRETEWGRESELGGAARVRGETESQAGSTLSTEPDMGLHLMTPWLWPEPKSNVGHSTDWATQVPQDA